MSESEYCEHANPRNHCSCRFRPPFRITRESLEGLFNIPGRIVDAKWNSDIHSIELTLRDR